MRELKQLLRKLKFFSRWWLIGKNHCETERQKKFFKFLHKLFIGLVFLSFALSFTYIYQLITGS